METDTIVERPPRCCCCNANIGIVIMSLLTLALGILSLLSHSWPIGTIWTVIGVFGIGVCYAKKHYLVFLAISTMGQAIIVVLALLAMVTINQTNSKDYQNSIYLTCSLTILFSLLMGLMSIIYLRRLHRFYNKSDNLL
eukprot:NODE_436_length_7460_cov_0.466105.p7 type:complete len:139 gc:universal NODE_436_length_7460_cov_0.466105:2556-2972(+)